MIKIGSLAIKGIQKTFSHVEEGALLALMGSSGYLEIAVNLGSALDYLGMDPEKIVGKEVLIEEN